MTEIEKIKKEIQKNQNTYLVQPLQIKRDYNEENSRRDDYKGRQIFELLQNADDCHSENYPNIKVKIILLDKKLIVQNTGVPFDSRGIASLMIPSVSSKFNKKNMIGNKGLGFRSVLNWTDEIDIYTNKFHVNFSSKNAKENFNKLIKNINKDDIVELKSIDRTAILSSPIVDDKLVNLNKYLDSNYVTSIVLNCDKITHIDIQNQLNQLKFEELLFLQHISEIKIVSPHMKKTITKALQKCGDEEYCVINNGSQQSKWSLWKTSGQIKQKNGKTKHYEIVLGYNHDKEYRQINRKKEGVLYSYFRTEVPMPFPYIVHCTFELTSERNSLIKNDVNNKILVEKLVNFIAQKAIDLAKTKNVCDYEALEFLIPYFETTFLDKEYQFTELLENKINNLKILPTISNKYVSIEENPKYFNDRLDLILNSNKFDLFLKFCEDSKICELFFNKRPELYISAEEINELIKNDEKYYIENKLNVKLIKLICNHYLNIGPLILTDSNGKWINNIETKVFCNPNKIFSLPDWAEMKFLDPEIEKELLNEWECSIDNLTDRLSCFRLEKYVFENVAKEINSQAGSDPKKINESLVWLFNIWKQNRHFESIVSFNNFKIVDRKGNICNCSNCYIGKEYDNYIGEKIVSNIESARFICDKKIIGLKNEKMEDVIDFLSDIGITKYPKINKKSLSNDQISLFTEYNRKKYPKIKYGLEIKDSTLFFNKNVEIFVASIQDIQNILEKSKFENILWWILKDENLYKHLISENEIDEYSKSSAIPYFKKTTFYIGKEQMISWLRLIFQNTKWIPTKTNKKVNSFNCLFDDNSNKLNLSPIIETVNIDYIYLNTIFGRNIKKELEVLFEKIGFCLEFIDLSKEKIYEILLSLPNLDKELKFGKSLYSEINSAFNANSAEQLIANNNKYNEFKQSGKVLTIKNNNLQYVPACNAVYVDKKTVSDDIINKYNRLALSRRAGDKKIQKIFCVKSIKDVIDISILNMRKHRISDEYYKFYQKLLPYIYTIRLQNKTKDQSTKNDLNILKNSKIVLVDEMTTQCKIDGKVELGTLKDYELQYLNDVGYVKIPTEICMISQLTSCMQFKQSLADAILTMLDIEGDKDAFMNIFGCDSLMDVEKYIASDDNDALLNKAKNQFKDSIDFKEEFWNSFSNILNISYNNCVNKYGNILGENFDYKNLNNVNNINQLIHLFNKAEIDIGDFNNKSFLHINVYDHYKKQFAILLDKYRDSYLSFRIDELISQNKTTSDFEKIKQNYDFMELDFVNSIKIDIINTFEQKTGIKINQIEKYDLNWKDKIKFLKNDSIDKDDAKDKKQDNDIKTNFEELNKKISESISDNTEKVFLSLPNKSNSERQKKTNKRTYKQETNKEKEQNGFIGESAVFNTLLRRKKDSVYWISENAEKAKKCKNPDDSAGYDIWYKDSKGKHYVEVKSTSTNKSEFILSQNELNFAMQNKETYELWFVFIEKNKTDVPQTKIIELGNIMMFENGESFFHNKKFIVEQSDYKIKTKFNH